MIGKWTFRIAALPLMAGILTTAITRADTPWFNLLATNRVEADPAKPYTLEEKHGPWIIMACSFNGQNGENAQKQAHDLVLELRNRYRMEAYVHRMDFKLDDPNGDVQPRYLSPHGHQYRMVKENREAYRDGAIKEIAVVVGNFVAVDDPEAQKALQKLKAADPISLHSKEDERSLAGWRSGHASVGNNGPLAHAFVTRNPLLPEDYFAPKGGLDELIVKMNKNVKYSLLNCPGKYTVQVAHFTGEVIINQGEIRAIESGVKAGPESTKQGLATAAEKANKLTEALRIDGYEAYEFHDRNSSQVTVGSFNSLGNPRPDGSFQLDPRVNQIVERFRAKPLNVPGGFGAIQPKSLVGIFFDAVPIPVEVPKRSISRELTRRLDMAGE